MTRFNEINFFIFLLIQIVRVSLIQAFPDTLTVKIKNDQEIITLNWKKTDRSVANTNLPIWYAWRSQTPELDTDMMDAIGPFAMYHDIEKSSAVVLFEYQAQIFGVVDTRFLITALPLSEMGPDKQQTVGERFVKKRSSSKFHDKDDDFPEIPFIDSPHRSPSPEEALAPKLSSIHGSLRDLTIRSRPARVSTNSLPNIDARNVYSIADTESESSNAYEAGRRGDTLYAEVLVFISHNVLQYFTKKDPDVILLVVYYLIHFNAIDILFAKLPDDLKIQINIAGLVIESAVDVFPYAFISTDGPSPIIDGAGTLLQFPTYLNRYRNVFPRDSFDFFYLVTRDQIHHKIDDGPTGNSGQPNTIACDGISKVLDMYENRIRHRGRFDVPGSLLEFKKIFGDYITSTHEIAHLMSIGHDPITAGVSCKGQQCFAILQQYGSYCKHCIDWSVQSIDEFRTYASENNNRCFLLNRPRSLQPYGTLAVTLGPQKQCTCYKFHSYWRGPALDDEVSPNHCNRKLACVVNDRLARMDIPRPVDGTPCGPNKVCWRKRCQPLVYLSFVSLPDQSLADI